MQHETATPAASPARNTASTGVKPLVEVKHLTKMYGNKKRPLKALDDFSLSLKPGRIVGLLGENGSGKTTLLKVLAGMLTPEAGTVTIDGHQPGPETKAITSFQPDTSLLPGSIKAAAAINTYAEFFTDFDVTKARELLDFFGLQPEQKTNEMSKGMREKLQLALVMSRQAKLYLLDEPISGVDPAARQALLDAILRGWNPEATLLISTHLVTDIEQVLDDAVFMHAGKLFKQGEADVLREEYGLSLDQIFRKEYSYVR